MTKLTQKHTDLLCHSLGINEHQREPYRNHYLAGDGHSDNAALIELVEAGYMTAQAAPKMWGDGIVYVVTEIGKQIAINSLPEPKKLTKAQSRYQDYLDVGDCYHDFAAFLGFQPPEREYGHSWQNRDMIRFRSPRATGEWCKTVKEAKASYKAAMKASKESEKEWSYV